MRELLVLAAALLVACGSDNSGDGSSGSSSGGSSSGSSSGGSGSGSSSGSSSTYSTELKTGIATYYDANGSGNCSFPATPNDLDVVALNDDEYAGSASCGSCMRVKGAKGEVVVRVVDSCPPCEKGHLDLSEQAFAKIDEMKKGRVSITYQTIACPVSGGLSYHFKDGSTKWWTAIQVRNHVLPIAKLEYKRGGAFVEMKRESYNYFVEGDGVGDLPGGLVLRVTAADGQVVEDTLSGDIPDDESVGGKAQFK